MTAFEVDTAFLSQFEEHVVAAAQHRELWMPAGQLAALNVQIVGRILVTHEFVAICIRMRAISRCRVERDGAVAGTGV